jgi:hypothetical protein
MKKLVIVALAMAVLSPTVVSAATPACQSQTGCKPQADTPNYVYILRCKLSPRSCAV